MRLPSATVLILSALLITSCSESQPSAPTPPPEVPAPPAPVTYQLSGTVKNLLGNNLIGATVEVLDAQPNLNTGRRTTTDSLGRYTLTNLSFTGFSIGVSQPGYVTASRGILLTQSAATATADFTLSPESTPISFNGITADGPLTSYSEAGFTVSGVLGPWRMYTTHGRPAPAIVFDAPPRTQIVGEVTISAGGRLFRFSSIDLYTSAYIADIEITGRRSGGTVLRLSRGFASQGAFNPIASPDSATQIDALTIRATVTQFPPEFNYVGDRFGIDNVRVAF